MAEAITKETILFALIGGILPALLWLWFWLKEDRHPEPRRIIIYTFLWGMLMVPLALILERVILVVEEWTGADKTFLGVIILLFLWAFVEEYLKYFAAKKAALTKISFDEPVDAIIYLITAALGFAALENTLFLLKVIGQDGHFFGFITGNLRFIGATLLHVATSAIVGASMAYAFFHKENMKRNVAGGLIIATILHFLYNYFIIKSEGVGIFKVFIPLWLIIIVIIFIFEKVKRIKS